MSNHYPFPTAVHTYFRALNKRSQKRDFLANLIEQPTFTYKTHWKAELLEERIKLTQGDALATGRLKVVHSSLLLQEDANELESFRAANAAIFTLPTRELAQAIFWRISQKVVVDTAYAWEEALELLGTNTFEHNSVGPSYASFLTYKKYLEDYIPLPGLNDDIKQALLTQLEATGLSDNGWQLRIIKGAEHAHIHHRAKYISIGKDYKPRSLTAARRIAVHEVLGHALRGPQTKLDESEGFAIVLEQLTMPTFAFRRTYRYLAVALGWGVYGKPMTFREVYEILWRLMIVNSKYSDDTAKEHAFDECYRAFRGGRPDVAGAVCLKDAVYFDANIRMWDVLDASGFSYNEFKDIIEGRRTVLS